MTIRTIVLATTVLATASGYAFAQSSPSPANQSGPNVDPSVQMPTDMKSEGDNVKGIPSRASEGSTPGAMRAPATTTGSGTSPMQESQEKNESPASQNYGIKDEK